jgi:hypothetical protein
MIKCKCSESCVRNAHTHINTRAHTYPSLSRAATSDHVSPV